MSHFRLSDQKNDLTSSLSVVLVFVCVKRLTFVFNPSSKVYDYTSVELKSNGENEVSIDYWILLDILSVCYYR